MATLKPLLTATPPNGKLPDIFYEIPEPPEDKMQQNPTIYTILRLLMPFYEDAPDVLISFGDFIFYDASNGNRRVSPDIYIVLGIDKEQVRRELENYWVWAVGKTPDIAIEVASASTARNDLGRKRALYAELGIAEYWRLDATGGDYYGEPLVGERLVDGEYRRMEAEYAGDGSVEIHSELLGLTFRWDGDGYDIIDPETGRTIDAVEVERQALAAEREARMEERRARLAERAARLEAEARERALQEEVARLRSRLDTD